MKYLRIAWVVLTIAVIGQDVAGVPYSYVQSRSVCNNASCAGPDNDRLTSKEASDLREMGLRDETDPDALGSGLVSVVRETMQPERVSLWMASASKLRKGER